MLTSVKVILRARALPNPLIALHEECISSRPPSVVITSNLVASTNAWILRATFVSIAQDCEYLTLGAELPAV